MNDSLGSVWLRPFVSQGPWSGCYNQIWLSVSLYLLQMGQWPLCLTVSQQANHSVSQPAIQPASQLSHRIMNDSSTRGRHEESIIRTERMLIRQQREKKGEKDAGRNRGVNTNGESERCKSQEGGGGAKKARKNSLKRHGWGWKEK